VFEVFPDHLASGFGQGGHIKLSSTFGVDGEVTSTDLRNPQALFCKIATCFFRLPGTESEHGVKHLARNLNAS
jgi:hypothetical protein